MSLIQSAVQALEVGKGQILVRIIPLLTALLIVTLACDVVLYRGLNDAQSMDNAQVARQIVRGQGFTTEFLRPLAVAQLRDYAMNPTSKNEKPHDLFPSDQFPPGTPRILPDTYNAPGYPYLLAAWFLLTRPDFNQAPKDIATSHVYSGERLIPLLNQLFMMMTAILVFILGRRLFDDRVAWMSLVAFLATDLVWRYTLTALSTSVLMFLVTAILICALEIYSISEACYENRDHSFAPAWFWALALGLLLAAACLTRLPLLALLIPLLVLFMIMPRANWLLCAVVTLLVIGLVTPWFLHLQTVSGNLMGSNTPLLLLGQGDFQGNQIYCTIALPGYEQLFKDVGTKEYTGFRWHFEHAWNLLGANPLILFFAASILHQFKRLRTRLFHWLLFGSAILLIAVNNLGSASPEALGPWNTLVLFFPCMLVIGGAFFFILLDRLDLHVRLLHHLIVILTVALAGAPLLLTLTNAGSFFPFPPYLPSEIKLIGELAHTDEWVTSDMPWATAWYGDRASLWLPDSVSDFEKLHDNICPTGILLLTPITWAQPFTTVTTGEYKEWFPFALRGTLPPTFPLTIHTSVGLGDSYYTIYSDHARWQPQ